MLDKLSDWLIRLSATGLVLMTMVIGWQIFGRFVLQSSPSWSEQVALLLMIWYILFASAVGVKEGFHIRISLLEDISSIALYRKIRLFLHILVAIFGIILLFYGAQLVWLVRDHVIPSLGLSRGIAYIPLPVTGLLISIFSMTHAYNDWHTPASEEA